MKNEDLPHIFNILFFIFAAVFFASCNPIETTELKNRHDWHLPVCLFVHGEDKEAKEFDLTIQAAKMNEELGGNYFHMSGKCNPFTDRYISVWFVKEYDDAYSCEPESAAVGCVRIARNKETKKVIHIDVVILDPYELETIRHELAHLAGCEHGDYKRPCLM